MNFYSPERPKGTDEEPRWLPFPQVVLPGLYIRPIKRKAGQISISIIVPSDGPYTSHWLEMTCNMNDLPTLIEEYEYDPEEMVRKYFEWKLEEVKRARVPSSSSSSVKILSLADLDL